MTGNSSLTTKQQRAIAGLVSCRTIAEAAEQAKVSERTLYRWMNDGDFLQALRQAEGGAIDGAVRVLVADLAANHETMRVIRDDRDNSAGVRLRAAMALDASLLRWRELRDVEGRLVVLEAALLESQHGQG